MARSLLRQLEQIRRSETYDDAVASIYTSGVAEPTVSGSLEEDLNNLRTLMRLTKGTTDWYGDLGKYFDPTSCSGGASTKDMNLSNIKGHTLDAKTVILAVVDDNAGTGFTVSGTSTGVMLTTTTKYADLIDKTGLPIFASTANAGTFFDEGGTDRVCRIDIINMLSETEIQDNSGNTIYAKFADAADNGGTGNGTDVFMAFYANGTPCDLSSVSGTLGNLKFVYPYRKRMTDMEEYEWQRTDFISSWEGDVEILEDIMHLWSYTGSGDNVSSTAGSWTNTTGYYPLTSDPASLHAAADAINTAIGDMSFSENNYILTDGASVATSLDALDVALKDISDSLTAAAGTKYVEDVSTLIATNVEHAVPAGATYTVDSTAGMEGQNMDVFVNGQLLAADTGVAGVNADRDYGETSASGITFRFNVKPGSNVVYVIRK